MNDIQPIDQSEIDMRIKEAETCYSMGMKRETATIYQQILNGLSGEDGQIRQTIQSKINKLQKWNLLIFTYIAPK